MSVRDRIRSQVWYNSVDGDQIEIWLVFETGSGVNCGIFLAFKATFDIIRHRFWWPTMSTDIHTHIEACLSCQHSTSSHRPPKLPVGHRPVTRAFQCVAVDLVEYKSLSQGNRFILSVIDHFTRFVVWYPSKIKRRARLFVIWSNACSRCLALQKHFIPTKARTLRMN